MNSVSNQRYAMLGRIVHSIGFGDIEIIDCGAIVYSSKGIIEEILDFNTRPSDREKLKTIPASHILDYSDKLIVPGFVDAHCHAPQYTFTGTGMDLPLLAWLEKYTFPSEAKFADTKFARMAYEKSVRRHLKHGTTTASYFGTLHLEASKVLVEVVEQIGQRAFVGKVSMDRNAPSFYVEDTQCGLKEAEEFVRFVLQRSDIGRQFLKSIHAVPNSTAVDSTTEEYQSLLDSVEVLGKRAAALEDEEAKRRQKRSRAYTDLSCSDITSANFLFSLPDCTPTGLLSHSDVTSVDNSQPVSNGHTYQSLLNRTDIPRVLPVITPRFVPTCSALLMTGLSELALKYGLPVQSHMSESVGEIQWVQSLHPECQGLYVDVYRRYGLIGNPLTSYMAHCVHSDHHEMVTMRRCNAGAVHCASSNFMLSSGIMDVRQFMDEGIKVAVGTDVAGGYSPSMLDALRQTIIASRAKGFQLQCFAPPPVSSSSSSASKSSSIDSNDDPQNDNESELILPSGGSSIPSDDEDKSGKKKQSARSKAAAAAASASSNAMYRALSYAEAFHLCTVGGAEVLGMKDVLGNFLPGKKLDCLIVDVNAVDSPIDTFGSESTSELFQKFLFLGDDRNLQAIYVDGEKVM